MRTDMMHSEMTIAAAARVEDLRRAATNAQIIAETAQRKRRTRPYGVRIGRILIEIGTRLQAMAGQPA